MRRNATYYNKHIIYAHDALTQTTQNLRLLFDNEAQRECEKDR